MPHRSGFGAPPSKAKMVAMNLDEMDLPDCLERLEDGSIRISGHRVSLYHVLDALYANHDSDAIEDLFPTIPPGKLKQAIDFCKNHEELMGFFHEEQRRAAEAYRLSRTESGPTRDELRRRMEEKTGQKW
jgi:uncharacterized protein (DUF433 family)